MTLALAQVKSLQLDDPAWLKELEAKLPLTLSTREVAGVLKCAPRTVRQALQNGEIECVRSGLGGSSRIVVPRGALIAYLRSRLQ